MNQPTNQYWFIDWVLNENQTEAYFAAANMNGLFKWDFNRNEVSFLGAFPVKEMQNELFYSGMMIGSKIFFPPRMADRMAVYDIKKNTISMESLYPENPYEGVRFHPSNVGYSMIPKGNDIFFIYRESPICVKWNTENNTCTYLTCEKTGERLILARDFVSCGGSYYMPSVESNAVLEVDISVEKLNYHMIGNHRDWRYGSIAVIHDDLWLLRTDRPDLVKWNPKTKDVKVFKNVFERQNQSYVNSYRLISKRECLYLIPALNYSGEPDEIIKFDPKTNEKVRYSEVFQDYRSEKKWPTFSFSDKYGYMIFERTEDLYRAPSVKHFYLDLESMTVTDFDIPLPTGWSAEDMHQDIEAYQNAICFRDRSLSGNPILENTDMVLEDFLANVKMQSLHSGRDNIVSAAGANIYHAVKKFFT